MASEAAEQSRDKGLHHRCIRDFWHFLGLLLFTQVPLISLSCTSTKLPGQRKSDVNHLFRKVISRGRNNNSRKFIRHGGRNEAGWERLSVAHGLDQPRTALVGSEPPCPARQRTKMSAQPSRIARPQSPHLIREAPIKSASDPALMSHVSSSNDQVGAVAPQNLPRPVETVVDSNVHFESLLDKQRGRAVSTHSPGAGEAICPQRSSSWISHWQPLALPFFRARRLGALCGTLATLFAPRIEEVSFAAKHVSVRLD